MSIPSKYYVETYPLPNWEIGVFLFWSRFVYDPIKDRLLNVSSNSDGNKTWQLKDQVFTQLSPNTPISPGRDQFSLVWDHVNEVMLLYAGDSNTALADLWAFDPVTDDWTFVHDFDGEDHPYGTCRFGTAVHLEDDYVLFFSGSNIWGGLQRPPLSDQTWKLDLHTYTFTQMSPSVVPSARRDCGMGYNPNRQTIIMGLGYGTAIIDQWRWNTYEWNGSDWTKILDYGDPGNINEDALWVGTNGIWVDFLESNVFYAQNLIDANHQERFFTLNPATPAYTEVSLDSTDYRYGGVGGYSPTEERLYMVYGANNYHNYFVLPRDGMGYTPSFPENTYRIFGITPPVISNQSPSPDERCSEIPEEISFDLVASGNIKTALTEIYLNDVLVLQGGIAQNNYTVTTTAIDHGYTYTITPPASFLDKAATYKLRVSAVNGDSTSNKARLDTSYVFHTLGQAYIWLTSYNTDGYETCDGYFYDEVTDTLTKVLDAPAETGINPYSPDWNYEYLYSVCGIGDTVYGDHTIVFAGGGDIANKIFHLDTQTSAVTQYDIVPEGEEVTSLCKLKDDGLLVGLYGTPADTLRIAKWTGSGYTTDTGLPNSTICQRDIWVANGDLSVENNTVFTGSLTKYSSKYLWRLDDDAWHYHGVASGSWRDVWQFDEDFGIATISSYGGTVYRWDHAWYLIDIVKPTAASYYWIAVFGFSATDVVIGGDQPNGTNPGPRAAHWDGNTWTVKDLPLDADGWDSPEVMYGLGGVYYAAGAHTIWKYDPTVSEEWTILRDFSYDPLSFEDFYVGPPYTPPPRESTGIYVQPRNVWNEFDEHAALTGLKRIRGETNWSLKRRTLDVFANRANSTYRGLVHGITRELGLSLFKPIHINPRLGNSFLAADPYILFDGAFLYLYSNYAAGELDFKVDIYQPGGNYEHLYRLVDLINSTVYFEAYLVSGYEYTKSATILNQSNRIQVNAEAVPVSTKFQLEHPNIVRGSIEFDDWETYNKVVSTENQVVSAGQYWVDYSNGIIRAYTVPPVGVNVRYQYVPYPFYPIASPVILHDINNEDFRAQMFQQILATDGTYLNGISKELGVDIINELYSVVPMYWGV